jgi:hypothetical protein
MLPGLIRSAGSPDGLAAKHALEIPGVVVSTAVTTAGHAFTRWLERWRRNLRAGYPHMLHKIDPISNLGASNSRLRWLRAPATKFPNISNT